MPDYWFPSTVAVLTATVIVVCCTFFPVSVTYPRDSKAVADFIKEHHLDKPGLPAVDKAYVDKVFDDQLKEYQASLATLQTNLYLQAAFILFGLLVMFGPYDEPIPLPVFNLQLQRSWLHFIVPAILLFLWLRFGFLLDGLIKMRLYCWESFLRSVTTGDKEYIRGGGALFEDSGFMDGWFASFRSEHLIDQKLVKFNKFIIFPSIFGVLLAANHAWILGLAQIGYARLRKKRERRTPLRGILFSLPWIFFFILVTSHIVFYLGGPNPNWFQKFVPGLAVVLLFLLTFLSRRRAGQMV